MTEYGRIWLLFLLFWASGAVFVWPMDKREHFWKRVAAFSLVIFSVFIYSIYFVESDSIWFEVILKNCFQVVMALFLYLCWEITFSVAIYNMIWGAALWQLLVEVWKVTNFFFAEAFEKSLILEIGAMILLFVFSYFICINTIAKWMPNDRKKTIGPRQTISALMLFIIIEMLSYAPALRTIDSYNHDWKFLYLSQMMCIVILYLQNELFKKSDMKQELELMNLLWTMEQEQYHLTKENIALINQKSHDLKHHVRAIRKASQEEIDKYLDDLEGALEIYESIVKTGNDVFDTILT